MNKENKISLLAITLTLFFVLLVSGIVVTSIFVNDKQQFDKIRNTNLPFGFQNYNFTIKITCDGTRYGGRCSFDGSWGDWTSEFNKIFSGNAFSCYYSFTKLESGYLKIEIYTNGVLTHSNMISSSTSSPISMSYTELNPSFKIVILLEFLNSYLFGNLIPRILMIVLGGIGIIISISIYKASIYTPSKPIYQKYPNIIYERYKPIQKYVIEQKQKMFSLNCPACKAPLGKNPPCECEYCGTMISQKEI